MSIRTFARKLDREVIAGLPKPHTLEAYGIRYRTDPQFRRAENKRLRAATEGEA